MSKIILITLFYVLFFGLNSLSQPKTYNFTIEGTSNIEKGTIILELAADSSLYPEELRNIKADVINGKFEIKGNIPHPLAYRISYGDRAYLSGLFVIDKGYQKIVLDTLLNKKVPQISNKIMSHDYQNYLNHFQELTQQYNALNSKWDSIKTQTNNKIPTEINTHLNQELKRLYRLTDSTLLTYVIKNPDSYYAFWRLAELHQFGFESTFFTIFNSFDKTIQNSFSGKNLYQNLLKGNELSIGKKIPKFIALNQQNDALSSNFYQEYKYTLVDFWYSNCGPCIAQFKELNEIYTKYHQQGFEIIGISTDRQKEKSKWIAAIHKHKLLWPQYWDIDGKESSMFSIQAFPTNLLIDSTGKIIAKNIKPSELYIFLNKSL
ncbi:AhpC/TSA family protein [Pedobacter aquae]|uniref:AhpC/TSA family protein n=1 Tax=Pedobacter aquae TaxID=2605747 RepID=A0A5C0VK47_9SPHI|nr:TlpA disulfide reductase family protein [Pedobacter aquae]QEK51590.1 AhpC/TSA family protein [Pedobacter aquae]